MYKKINVLIIFSLCFMLFSCGTPDKKEYTAPAADAVKTYSGTALITEIRDLKDDSADTNKGYAEIFFNFTPADTEAPKSYLCPKCTDNRVKLYYDNRDSFHATWVRKWNIKPGSSYRAIRHELLRGDNTASVSYEVILEPR